MMKAFDHSEEEIAAAAGIARMTLRQHYAEELAFGRMKVRGEVLGMLWASARGGNVSAQKHLELMTSDRMGNDGKGTYRLPEGAQVPASTPTAPEAAEEKPEKPLGKKAQRLLDAANPDLSNPMGALMAERHAPPANKRH